MATITSESPTNAPATASRTNILDGSAYLVAVVVGVVPVFLSPQMWFVPIVVMGIYLALGYRLAKTTGFIFEFADSFYYLGFTLSVGSLLAALDPFRLSAKIDPETVFHYFGLGMLTTLMGVAGRTVIQMYHRTPSESVEALNSEIARKAALFIEELDEVHAAAGLSLRRVTRQVEEIVEPAISTLHDRLARLSQQYTLVTENAERLTTQSAKVQDQVVGLSNNIGLLSQALGEEARTLREVVPHIRNLGNEAAEAGITSVKSVHQSVTSVNSKMGEVAKSFDELASQIRRQNVDLSPITQTASAAAGALSTLGSSAEGSITALQRTTAAASTHADSLQATSGRVDDWRKAIDALNSNVQTLAAAVSKLNDVNKLEFQRTRDISEATFQTTKNLSNVVDEIISAVKQRLADIR